MWPNTSCQVIFATLECFWYLLLQSFVQKYLMYIILVQVAVPGIISVVKKFMVSPIDSKTKKLNLWKFKTAEEMNFWKNSRVENIDYIQYMVLFVVKYHKSGKSKIFVAEKILLAGKATKINHMKYFYNE